MNYATQPSRRVGESLHGDEARPTDALPLPERKLSVQTVVDVGGGTGALLAEILRARPNTRGILVDLPSTVARSVPILQEAGVAKRVTLSGQSFFDPLPSGLISIYSRAS